MEAQSAIGDLDHIVFPGHRNADVGGHAWEQFLFGIIERDDGVVGDDVLDCGRVHAHLAHRSGESLARERVHAELRGGPHFDLPHVGLVRLGIDQHLGQVLGDNEQRGRLQAGGDSLADIDVPRDHRAVNGCPDGGMVQVDVSEFRRGLPLLHLCFGLVELRDGGFQPRLRLLVLRLSHV